MSERICPICEAPTSATDCPSDGFPTLESASYTRMLPPDMVGRTFEGKYRVLREVGRGGMGRVFVAKQRFIDRVVAVKFLEPQAVAGQKARQRFLNEARILSKLSHPNTVRVFDFGFSPEGVLFLVMEYVEGRGLDQLLASAGGLAVRRAVDITIHVLQALDEVHRHGIVHRDLKPSNILLTRVGADDDFVKVLDFGIAREQDEDEDHALTGRGLFVGTAAYASPEQARGRRDLDGRSDLFSVGTVLREMLTGCATFSGETPWDVLRRIDREEADPLPDQLRERLGPVLPGVIDTALHKDRDQRFQSAAEMIRALRHARDKAPAAAPEDLRTTRPLPLPASPVGTPTMAASPTSETAILPPPSETGDDIATVGEDARLRTRRRRMTAALLAAGSLVALGFLLTPGEERRAGGPWGAGFAWGPPGALESRAPSGPEPLDVTAGRGAAPAPGVDAGASPPPAADNGVFVAPGPPDLVTGGESDRVEPAAATPAPPASGYMPAVPRRTAPAGAKPVGRRDEKPTSAQVRKRDAAPTETPAPRERSPVAAGPDDPAPVPPSKRSVCRCHSRDECLNKAMKFRSMDMRSEEKACLTALLGRLPAGDAAGSMVRARVRALESGGVR